MLRLQLVVIFLVSALGVSADEPCCQPTVRTRAQMREFTDSSCVCAMYPVWDDGNDNYLYYAEICGGPPSCPIEDVVYFYEGPLVWPQSCATGGDCGDCEGPNPTEKGQGAKDKAPDKFKGLSAKAPWTTTLKDFLPQDNKIKYPDNSGKTASPRKGINDSASFFVIFNANGETVVAKVFVAAADGKD